jgi:hypothetical protein
MAMSEASKLFDSSGGGGGGNKQEVVSGAAMTVMKLMTHQGGGGGGGMLGMAEGMIGGGNSGGLGPMKMMSLVSRCILSSGTSLILSPLRPPSSCDRGMTR